MLVAGRWLLNQPHQTKQLYSKTTTTMSNESLADRAVDALAEVRAIGENMDNEHSMRHTVRSMKRVAEQILSDAMRQATEIAYQAKRLVKDHDEAMKGGSE